MSVESDTPLLIAYESIRQTKKAEPDSAILVSQNFYRVDDRYRTVGNQRFDKFVTDEFVRQVVYGCQIVITNSTSSRQKLSALLQLPAGSVPVSGAHYTRSHTLTLEPYRTETVDYHFYFPASGTFEHYPVHVSRDDVAIAAATPFQFNVVDKATVVDRDSWHYISQHGDNSDVLKFLQEENLHDVPIHQIAFRMSDRAFFDTVISVLKDRHRYDHTLWSYSVMHDRQATIAEYLLHAPEFVQHCGMRLHSDLLTIDPVERGTYQHLEYQPLVNARGSPGSVFGARF